VITLEEIKAEAEAQWAKSMPKTGNPAIDQYCKGAFLIGFSTGGKMAMAAAIAMIDAEKTLIRISKESQA
jgi:spore coat protein CotF